MKMELKECETKELNSYDKVVKATATALDNGRQQLFAVAEKARNEFLRLRERLQDIDRQVEVIDEELQQIEELEGNVSLAVQRITSNIEIHTEEEIRDTFEKSKELHLKSARLLERRSQLENKKRELKNDLLSFESTAEKAENMVSQVGMVMDLINGNLKDLNLKIENLQQKQQFSLQIIKAQEEERRRMARDIHDGPAQSMANVVFRMEFCEKLFDLEPDRVRDELRDLKDVVKNNLQDVRKIIFDLRPMALDDLGLVPALKRYIDNFRQNQGMDVNLNILGKELRLEAALEIAVFRLVQEALNNVAKHAGASVLNITVETQLDFITAVIEDNGKGFALPSASLDAGSHYGLISMRERVHLLGGELDISSQIGRGTKVFFRLPIKLREQISQDCE